jgi:hypothetical protein
LTIAFTSLLHKVIFDFIQNGVIALSSIMTSSFYPVSKSTATPKNDTFRAGVRGA